jgi:hypothetical protein
VKRYIPHILTGCLFLFIGCGVYLNIQKQRAMDRSKIPPKVELYRGFQRWITNLKNNDIDISADDFRLKEENEIYNTQWLAVYSIEDQVKKAEFDKLMLDLQNVKRVIFSPSQREFIDYRNEIRGTYQPNQIHFYGQKEDKIIDARILDCSVQANCYFDRAYFVDNDIFVISEISRNIDKNTDNNGEKTPVCDINASCTYTVKVHVIDLVRNSRLVYESKPFELVLSELIPQL